MKDALGSVQSILVLGGTSDIGLAIAAKLAVPRRATVILAGRRPEALRTAAAALRTAGAGRVETIVFDADDTIHHEEVIATAASIAGVDLDIVVLAFGVLGEQARDEAGGDGAVRLIQTNYLGAASVSLAVARMLRTQGHGTLIVLSSVAGQRVRRANFIYGSSKAALDGFAQGLGDSLAGSGANVLIVRPGFVRTKMTDGLPATPLSTTADAVAAATVEAIAAGREVIWVPGVLRLVFAILRYLPPNLWRRLSA